jgi:HTH-like domain
MKRQLPVAVVCAVCSVRPARPLRRNFGAAGRLHAPGPATPISDDQLLALIRQVLAASPFVGEGYRKLRARLRRQHRLRVSGKRISRLRAATGCWPTAGSWATQAAAT